jgi:type VI secretion system secreted protein Hcp
MKAIKSLIVAAIVALTLVMFTTASSAAAVDYFLKIEGIEGESTAAGYEGQLEIISFSWGVERARDTNAPTLADLKIVAKVNKATPKLMLACATGQHIPEAKLTCRKAGGSAGGGGYYKITFSDLVVSSYQTGGSGSSSGDVVPTDQFSLNFSQIKVEYEPQDDLGNPTGPIVTGEWPPTTPTAAE